MPRPEPWRAVGPVPGPVPNTARGSTLVIRVGPLNHLPVYSLSVIVPTMSDKISSPKRPRRLPDTIAEYLMATARDLAPGTKLPSENQLAKQFGVSRSA